MLFSGWSYLVVVIMAPDVLIAAIVSAGIAAGAGAGAGAGSTAVVVISVFSSFFSHAAIVSIAAVSTSSERFIIDLSDRIVRAGRSSSARRPATPPARPASRPREHLSARRMHRKGSAVKEKERRAIAIRGVGGALQWT